MRLQSIGGRIAMPDVSQDVQQPFRSAQPTTPMPQDDLAGALLAAQQHAQVPANSFQSTFLGPVAEFYHNKRQNALDEKAVMAQQSAAQAQAQQEADQVYQFMRQALEPRVGAGKADQMARTAAQEVLRGTPAKDVMAMIAPEAENETEYRDLGDRLGIFRGGELVGSVPKGAAPSNAQDRRETATRKVVDPESGNTYEELYDKATGEAVGDRWLAGTRESDAGGLSVKDRAGYDAKMTDVDEAIQILDEAENALKNIPTFLGVKTGGTGPVEGRAKQMSKWNQGFQTLADSLFAVAKRIYKNPGEGQFSDADAAALRGMLFDVNRDEGPNAEQIKRLREWLGSRREKFKELASSGSDSDEIKITLIED